jgi:hypothetical protein
MTIPSYRSTKMHKSLLQPREPADSVVEKVLYTRPGLSSLSHPDEAAGNSDRLPMRDRLKPEGMHIVDRGLLQQLLQLCSKRHVEFSVGLLQMRVMKRNTTKAECFSISRLKRTVNEPPPSYSTSLQLQPRQVLRSGLCDPAYIPAPA